MRTTEIDRQTDRQTDRIRTDSMYSPGYVRERETTHMGERGVCWGGGAGVGRLVMQSRGVQRNYHARLEECQYLPKLFVQKKRNLSLRQLIRYLLPRAAKPLFGA